ncbi:unnamed protein product, partial [Allacma fusca]
FLDFNHEPVTFVSALSKRAIELAEMDRSIDLMSTIQPKTFAEQNKLSQLVTGLLQNQDSKSEVEGIFRDYLDDDNATDFTDDSIFSSGPFLKRKFLVFAKEYINLRRRTFWHFSHPEFEQTMTGLILQLLQDYDNKKTVLVPKDYAKCFAFLLSIGYENEAERQLSPNMNALECIGLAKLNLRLQTHFEFHPIFTTCMRMAASDEFWNNSRVAKELLNLMISSGLYLPVVLERVSKIICEFPNDVSVILAERFLWACFTFGVEGIKGIEESARIITRNSREMHPLPLLESALALCFQGCLDRETVAKTFCVEFLDEVDRYIKATHYISLIPRRLRDVFMELNRAVCLDMPEANVPWFHEKYCTEVAAIEGYRRETYLHSEVAQVLEDVVGKSSHFI